MLLLVFAPVFGTKEETKQKTLKGKKLLAEAPKEHRALGKGSSKKESKTLEAKINPFDDGDVYGYVELKKVDGDFQVKLNLAGGLANCERCQVKFHKGHGEKCKKDKIGTGYPGFLWNKALIDFNAYGRNWDTLTLEDIDTYDHDIDDFECRFVVINGPWIDGGRDRLGCGIFVEEGASKSTCKDRYGPKK